MHVADLLARAVQMMPPTAVNEAGATAADAREYLEHDEWEVALGVLENVCNGWWPPAQWWDLLVDAAELMELAETATWCRWRRRESVHGIVRAELRLFPSSEGGRATAVPGPGALSPLWDIGQLTPAGDPDLREARMWVEFAPEFTPGTVGTVRLAPLVPHDWQGVRVGQSITMYEGTPARGAGTIIEASAPTRQR